jgi:2-(3-amino-3-carboxypropyl)histidine synthase
VDITSIKTLYVFVDIQIDVEHFVRILKHNLKSGALIALVSTIQFSGSLHFAKKQLEDTFQVIIPQIRPLSPGEILGCTSPHLKNVDYIVYLGDGKFHLESMLIHNPNVPAFRYDPYSSILTNEEYDHKDMLRVRKDAITQATGANKWGLIFGTLGRQGSPSILHWIQGQLIERGVSYVVVCMSEVFPARLAEFDDVEAWVQIACPRLSIDWGRFFSKPLLTPYEAAVVLNSTEWKEVYPMDFYATSESSGPWGANFHRKPPSRPCKLPPGNRIVENCCKSIR